MINCHPKFSLFSLLSKIFAFIFRQTGQISHLVSDIIEKSESHGKICLRQMRTVQTQTRLCAESDKCICCTLLGYHDISSYFC